MMKKFLLFMCVTVMCVASFGGCSKQNDTPKIGVSFGVGAAERWKKEKVYMEERAAQVGAQIEVRLNLTDEPKTQLEDCKELIDSGIDVLIYIPRDGRQAGETIAYAKEKKVKVINYARVVLGAPVDLLVGYDSEKIGQMMAQYATETSYKGDYIILRGDENDNNAVLLYNGAIKQINANKDNINIVADKAVAGWSADLAKEILKKEITNNGNKVDAIFAPNDKIAGACAEVVKELGITTPVVITGMDAELDAIKRIVAGTQSMTIHMDLKELSTVAVDEAVKMAKGEQAGVNSDFDNQSGSPIKARLINGKLVTKENLNRILIDTGVYTKEQVYGE